MGQGYSLYHCSKIWRLYHTITGYLIKYKLYFGLRTSCVHFTLVRSTFARWRWVKCNLRTGMAVTIMNNTALDEVRTHKHLGITLSYNLTWNAHIDELYIKAMKRLNIIQSFKFKLARKDLERFYLSFVLPLIDYGDVLWNGASEYELDKLDCVHIRAMRIITGATEKSDLQRLFIELGWHTLTERRKIHRLKCLYTILNNMYPSYLTDLIPPTMEECHTYGLQWRENITPFRTQRQYFSKSYFPSTVRDWNALPLELRNSLSLHSFNVSLHYLFSPPPKTPWYGQGDRFLDIHHTRMRLGCSKLKAHLFYNLHVVDSPFCACGPLNEDASHYFLHCPLYDQQRITLFNDLINFEQFDVSLLLFGDNNLTLEENKHIVFSVQKFIKSTGRFVN